MPEIGPQAGILLAIMSVFGGVIGAIITFLAQKASAKITSKPDLIRVTGEWVDRAEDRITKLEKKQEDLEKEISSWKRNYFRLREWLKKFFEENGINVKIPEFHKETSES